MDNQTSTTPEPQSPSPAASAPDQPNNPYRGNWKKWLLIYLSIGAMIYAGVYYFVLSKQGSKPYTQPVTKTAPSVQPSASPRVGPDLTTNLKTHTSKRMSISFKYPAYWQVKESNDFNFLSISNYPFDKYHRLESAQIPYEKGDYLVGLTDSGYQGYKTPEELIKLFESQKDAEDNYYHESTSYNYLTKKDETKRTNYILKNQKVININGYNALYREEGSLPIFYMFDGLGKVIKIDGDAFAQNQELFSSILQGFTKSFRFTN